MKFIKTKIEDLFITKPDLFEDERGQFYRVFCKKDFKEINLEKDIVQINFSLSKHKGTIRGLHYQCPPKMELKMVKCIKGSVFDIALDLRKNSKTFLKWHGEILSSDNIKMFYIPEGFAHGFQTLEDDSELLYFHTEYYSPEYEAGLRYDDPVYNIKWPLEPTQISKRDNSFDYINKDFEGI